MKKMQIKRLDDHIDFDEQNHIYKVDGEVYPSVTEIMRPLTDTEYRDVDADVLANAAKRGTEVHSAIDTYCNFDIEDIDPQYQLYFDAFKAWLHDYDVAPIVNEYQIYNKTVPYAGTMDLIAEVKGEYCIVDFKTSYKVSPMLHQVQLEAYKRAFLSHYPTEKISKKLIVHLKKTGEYKVYEMNNDTLSWDVFNACLMLRNYKNQNNK